MQLVHQSVERITEQNPYKAIELAGRTCYRSEDKITSESSIKFTNNLIKSGHTAMLEHTVLCFELNFQKEYYRYGYDQSYVNYLKECKYFHVTTTTPDSKHTRVLVSANIRAINERKINDPIYQELKAVYPNLAYADVSDYTMFPHISAKIITLNEITNITDEEILEHYHLTYSMVTNRAVTHELVRHRPCSFAQESTRYCGYNNDKFGNELTFIIPADYESWSEYAKSIHQEYLSIVEKTYMTLITEKNTGLVPQQARDVLPNGLKTKIVVTTNMKEWNHILNLRYLGTTGAPHPDIKELTGMVYQNMLSDELAAKVIVK